jgi:hypothetical protein
VIAATLLSEMERPILIEIIVGTNRTELQDRLSTVNTPARTGDIKAILDKMPAGTLYNTGSDRPTVPKRCGIVQVGRLVLQIGRGAISVSTLFIVEALPGCLATDRRGGQGRFALKDRQQFLPDPLSDSSSSFSVMRPTRPVVAGHPIFVALTAPGPLLP